MIIALDAGHGVTSKPEFDTGAISQFVTEYELNMLQVQRVAELLRLDGHTVGVFTYPPGAPKLGLVEKGKRAFGHDLFISFHHNSAFSTNVQGCEVLVLPGATAQDKLLAGSVLPEIVKVTGYRNRGIKEQKLGVLQGVPVGIPKCLVESYFLTYEELDSKDELVKLSLKCADAIAEGIIKYCKGGKNATGV